MKVLIKDEDLLFVKSFYKRRYPKNTHALNLDSIFDYYNGLCSQFLKKSKKLTAPILPINLEYEELIKESIEKNLDTNKDLSMYHQMLILVIQILNNYYKEDGTLKLEYIEKAKGHMKWS